MAAVNYHIAGCVSPVSGSNELPKTGGKIEVAADGAIIRLKGAKWWEIYNTAKYDAAGTETAADYSVFIRYGSSAPNLTYAGATTAADLETLALKGDASIYLQPPGVVEEWTVYVKPSASATNGVTILVLPNISFVRHGE